MKLRDQHKVELIGLVCENILPSVIQWLIPIQINLLILLFLCLQINETNSFEKYIDYWVNR